MIRAWLRLLRAGALFSPAADVIAGMSLAGAVWSLDALRAAGASVLLYGAGMVLNDHADRHEDAVQRPERPIPRGDIGASAAVVAGLALVALCLVLTPFPLAHGILAALVLAYDYALKRIAWAGAITMGVLRAGNLALGSLLVLPDPVPGHPLLYAAGAYGVYILAVTLLGILEDHRTVKPKAVVSLLALPPVVAFLALFSVEGGFGPAPGLAAVLAIAFIVRNRRVGEWTAPAIRAAMTWLLLGTMVYTALLCVSSDRPWEGLGIAACIPLARAISQRIAMT